MRFRFTLVLVSLVAGGVASAANTGNAVPASFYANTFSKKPTVAGMTELGREIFRDAGLSASGKQSCASCHDPAYAYGPPNALSVQAGGADMQLRGMRAVPSIRYLQKVPAFSEHYFDDETGGADQGPTGGYTWDGRAGSVHEQARLPLFSPLEMANTSQSAIVARLRGAAYAPRMRAEFGDDLFTDEDRAVKAALLALEVFQQSPADFSPYASKYDAFLRGKVKLSVQESRGLTLFNNPRKGNCAVCHPSGMQRGALPAFSDWGFVALGVPRNHAIPANARADFYDLGLCGPQRTDFREKTGYCGLFRTPSLRNVALRKTFFHNGVFHSLKQVLDFYVERDLHPEKFYGTRQGVVAKFDDLPPAYHGNVNREPPFDRKPGQAPALSPAEVDDVIAFLKALSDGYRAGARE